MKLQNLRTLNSRQLTRVIILLGILLVLGTLGFGAYYYSQRYMAPTKALSPEDQELVNLGNAVRKDPSDLESRIKLAETYLLNRRYDEALTQANKILEAYPNNDRAMLTIGVAQIYKENYKEAIPPLEAFITIHEKLPMASLDTSLESAFYFAGMAYTKTSSPEKAIAVLTRALEFNSADADAMYQLGLAYAATGKHAEAIQTYERAILFVPDFVDAYQGMVDSYVSLKDNTKANYARAMVAFSIQDYQTATSELERVISELPDFMPAHIGLAMSYHALGNLAKARESIDIALLLDPQNTTALRVSAGINNSK
jgi:tetratricopeptide (TPR) repeat protein